MGLAHGIHGWADVIVPDMAAAATFYTGLFGWEAESADSQDEQLPYTMFNLDGKHVAGMGQLRSDQAAAGVSATWSSYIIVDDVDAILERATALGATTIMEPMQVMDAGRMLFMFDPVGAAIGFWESGTHDGAEVFNVPNAVTWNDLGTRDVEAATTFYADLLAWEPSEMDMGDGKTYTMFANAGRMNGGAWDISGEMPDEIPSFWMTWFRVDDCSDMAQKVVDLGGTVMSEPEETGVGVSAVVTDPSGAVFGIIQTKQSDDQPPR